MQEAPRKTSPCIPPFVLVPFVHAVAIEHSLCIYSDHAVPLLMWMRVLQALVKAVPGAQPLMDAAARNFQFWKQEQQRQGEGTQR